MNVAARPPIGVIVEGDGEAVSYPGLISRICGASLNVPVVNAGGYGGILANLHEHLDDLALRSPFAVMITVDLRDVLRSTGIQTCEALVRTISQDLADWKAQREEDRRFTVLPSMYSVVVQVPKFEAWWLGDAQGLVATGLFQLSEEDCDWENADEAYADPHGWLRQRTADPTSLKRRQIVLEICRTLDPGRMRQGSRSFDKFFREVTQAYSHWYEQVCRT